MDHGIQNQETGRQETKTGKKKTIDIHLYTSLGLCVSLETHETGIFCVSLCLLHCPDFWDNHFLLRVAIK